MSLPPSVKRDHEFEEICESLESIFGGTMKTSYNIVKSHLTAGEIPNSLENPSEANKKSLDEHHDNNMGEAKHGDSSPHYKQQPHLADDKRISQYISQRVRNKSGTTIPSRIMGYRTESAGSVAEAKNDNEIKDTKVLKFTSETYRDDAREGKTIRFMHNMDNGTPHWL